MLQCQKNLIFILPERRFDPKFHISTNYSSPYAHRSARCGQVGVSRPKFITMDVSDAQGCVGQVAS